MNFFFFFCSFVSSRIPTRKILQLLFSQPCRPDSAALRTSIGICQDGWLWYGLQSFCCIQGRGDRLLSLTWQPKESLECWTEFTLKVTLQCTLPYLGEWNSGRKKKQKKRSAPNFLTLAIKKVRTLQKDYLLGLHTSLCTHMNIWKLWNVKKYVFLVGCKSSFWKCVLKIFCCCF